jgi:hypothetical protein
MAMMAMTVSLACRDRMVVNRTCSLKDDTFTGCQTYTEDGGALYVTDYSIVLMAIRCLFEHCCTSANGGAIFIKRIHTFRMMQSWGEGCECGGSAYGGFLYAEIYSSAAGTLVVSESSGVRCAGGRDLIWLTCYAPYSTSGSTTSADGLNATANDARETGSGLCMSQLYSVALFRCRFSANGQRNCLYFERFVLHNNCSLVVFDNNSCHIEGGYPGVLRVMSPLEFTCSIFVRNKFDLFVGGDQLVSFLRCAFDFDGMPAAPECHIKTRLCVRTVDATPYIECPTDTPPIDKNRSVVPIAAGIGGGLAGIAIIAGVFYFCRRSRDTDAGMTESLEEALTVDTSWTRC